MPHSLKAKIKGLRYKGIITDKDCERLCKALDNEDVLEQIRAEIMKLDDINPDYPIDRTIHINRNEVLGILDKYKGRK